MPDPVRVFVSHHHSPAEDNFTARLVGDLTQAGGKVWVDVADIHEGDFMERINAALATSDWVVLVLTPAALRSQPVRMEINAAITLVWQGRLRGVIPIIAEPTNLAEIPPTWGILHRYDATREYPAALDGLLRALGLSSAPAVQPSPPHPFGSAYSAGSVVLPPPGSTSISGSPMTPPSASYSPVRTVASPGAAPIVAHADRMAGMSTVEQTDRTVQAFSVSRAVWVTVGVVACSLVFSQYSFPLSLVAMVLPAAFWAALTRLPHVTTRRAIAEALGLSILLALPLSIAEIMSLNMHWARLFGGNSSLGAHGYLLMPSVALVILADLIGVGLAVLFARWDAVQRHLIVENERSEAANALICVLGISIGATAAASIPSDVFEYELATILLGLLGAAAIAILAARTTLRRLRAASPAPVSAELRVL